MNVPLRNRIRNGPRWILVFSSAAGLAGAAALFSLVANILILRTLPVVEVGGYALLAALVQMISLIGALGQPGLMKRLYSLQPLGHYDWLADLGAALLFSLPALGLGVLTAGLVYRLPVGYICFVAITSILLMLSNCVSEMLNSQRRYPWASLLLHLPNAMMIFPALLVLLSPGFARLDVLLAAQLLFAAFTLLLGIGVYAGVPAARVHTARVPPGGSIPISTRGSARIPIRDRWQGLGFCILLGTYLVPYQGLISIAAGILPAEPLAAYSAFGVLVRPFYLLQGVMIQILSVEVIRRRRFPGRWVELGLWIAAFILFATASFALPEMASRIYGGRYDDFRGLLLPLSLAGALLIPETFPRSFITGRAPWPLLNSFTTAQVVVAGTGAALAFFWGRWLGASGIAWAGVCLIGLRCLAAYAYALYARRKGLDVSTLS